ncbi:MAG: hypothetical protein KF746_03000 [Chitinophagaceae bacterium]|nr:hypothetical protein [Chitinophagaceae bacterium]
MTYTISVICSFLGFFMLYNTSRKAKLSAKGPFEKWLQQHRAAAKATGVLLVVISFVMLSLKDGLGVGMLTAFLLLMAAASLIIIIAPFQYLRLKYIIALAGASFILEFLFT